MDVSGFSIYQSFIICSLSIKNDIELTPFLTLTLELNLESFHSLSPTYKLLPPLVVTPPDDRIKLTDYFANRYRSHQYIHNSNYSFSEQLSPSSPTLRWPSSMRSNPRRQQSFELIDSTQSMPHHKFKTERVDEGNVSERMPTTTTTTPTSSVNNRG